MQKRVSVAMAVYNGQSYIKEQIDSIIGMMSFEDELLISYDISTDRTLEIISEYAVSDERVKILINKSKGVQQNFNNAVKHCEGRYVLFADQDDIWINDKINKVVNCFEKSNADVIVHNGYFIDMNSNQLEYSIFEFSKVSISPLRNFIKGTYWGCCMAFKNDITEVILPFPGKGNVSHDLWTGVVGGLLGEIRLINEPLILHRLHNNNVTPLKRNKIITILKNRFYFAKNIYLRRNLIKEFKNSI